MINLSSLSLYSPLEGFEVRRAFYLKLPGWDFSLTNVSLLIILILFVNLTVFRLIKIYNFEKYSQEKTLLVTTTRLQLVQEYIFNFVKGFYLENVGKNSKYFIYVLFLFLLIVFSNLFGMIPFSFTVTSQIIITFSASLMGFIAINIIGFRKHGLVFFSMFLPSGVPLVIAPFLIPIEFISYNARVFSLAIRLFANMMSGHALMHILGGFCLIVFFFFSIGIFGTGVMVLFILAVSVLELAIAILQAYVFTVLVCIYLNDALNLH